MELRHLRYFATVAGELNFTRAAEKLRVAQPALSRQIKQLEHELGVELLLRDKRKVSLTEEGAAFLVEAQSILQQTGEALERVRGRAHPVLRIGYVWGLFHSIVPRALQRFREGIPDIRVDLLDLSAAEQGKAMTAGKLDAGFIGFAFEADAAGLEKQKVGVCDFVVALPASHPLAKRKAVSLAALAREVFLLISEEHFPGASEVMMNACIEAGFRPKRLQVAERGHTILGLVASGCGVALLPASLRELPHGGVVFRWPSSPVSADLFLAWRRGLLEQTRNQLLAAVRQN